MIGKKMFLKTYRLEEMKDSRTQKKLKYDDVEFPVIGLNILKVCNFLRYMEFRYEY